MAGPGVARRVCSPFLAGFVEPGRTPRGRGRREVLWEEGRVQVGAVSYLPANLAVPRIRLCSGWPERRPASEITNDSQESDSGKCGVTQEEMMDVSPTAHTNQTRKARKRGRGAHFLYKTGPLRIRWTKATFG